MKITKKQSKVVLKLINRVKKQKGRIHNIKTSRNGILKITVSY